MSDAKVQIIGAVVQADDVHMVQASHNMNAITKAVDDATLYGSGFIRVDADGNLQRLDPLRIIVEYKLD